MGGKFIGAEPIRKSIGGRLHVGGKTKGLFQTQNMRATPRWELMFARGGGAWRNREIWFYKKTLKIQPLLARTEN